MPPDPKRPFDLRRPRPPQPPPSAAPSPAPSGGPRPPAGFLPQGQVLRPEQLTEYERRRVEQLGVSGDAPVPGDLADIIQDIKNEAALGLALDPNFQVTNTGVVEIEDLTPAQQAQVRQVLRQVAEQQAQLASVPTVPNAAPGVNEALRQGTLMGMQQSPPITLVDDRLITHNQPQAPAAAQTPRTSPLQAGSIPPGGVYVHKGRVDDLPPEAIQHFQPHRQQVQAAVQAQPAATPPPPPPTHGPAGEPAPGTMTDTGAGDARYCPHCGWNQALKDGVGPTDADKYTFLWSILGGPDKRFTKTVELMGGRLKVKFRTLTSREADQTLLQVAHDYRRGQISGDTNWWQRWMDYRLAFALAEISAEGIGVTYVGPDTLGDIEYDPPVDERGEPLPHTPYPALWSHLEESHLYNESLRRAVSLAYASFVDLTKKLENNYDNRDFWRGIGAPA